MLSADLRHQMRGVLVMHFFPAIFSFKTLKQVISLFSFILLLLLAGCGSDDHIESSAQDTSKSAHQQTTTPPPQNRLESLDSQSLHDTAIELFAMGLSTDDPATIMKATAMLEEAVTINPDNTAYWIDLADAYLNSGIVLQYPYAIDIYWMLYQEGDPQKTALLTRLAEAYHKIGNLEATFSVSRKRLELSNPAEAAHAGLYLAMLAPGNGKFRETIQALKKKAEALDDPGYLLLLAAALGEVSESEDAIELLDKAIAEVSNPDLLKLAKQAKERMVP